MTDAFWKTTPLAKMNREQWESLCDGCGKCCLNKLEDEDTGEIVYTNAACKLLDSHTCQCKNYEMRTIYVPECVELLAENLSTLRWLPSTCAYRLVYEGKDLPKWHHLISGDRNAIHKAGASVQDRTVSEEDVYDLEDHVVSWPE